MNTNVPSPTVTCSLDHATGMLLAIDKNNHSFRIPLSINGLRILKAILEAKELQPDKWIGSNAMPVQQMVDDFLKGRRLEKENELVRQDNKLQELF